MIVRFRRLHGTVGMPGEAKGQQSFKDNQPEKKKENSSNDKSSTDYSETSQHIDLEENDISFVSFPIAGTRTTSECSDFDPSSVKSEPYDYGYDEFEDVVEKTEEQFTEQHHDVQETEVPEQEVEAPLEAVVKKEPEFVTPFLPEGPKSDFPIFPIRMKEEPKEREEPVEDVVESILPVVEEPPSTGELIQPKVEVENGE